MDLELFCCQYCATRIHLLTFISMTMHPRWQWKITICSLQRVDIYYTCVAAIDSSFNVHL